MKAHTKVLYSVPSSRHSNRRSGQALIGLLVVVLIGMALYFLLLGPRQGNDGQMRPSVARQSIDRAEEVGGTNYISQIQSAVEMYKNDNDGKPPASLEELKRYAKDYPPEMWVDPISKLPLNYDPATGIVSSPGARAGRPAASNPSAPLVPAIPGSGTANSGDSDLGTP